MAAGDSDVDGCADRNLRQTFHLHDRAQQYRQSISLYGAGHEDFHNGGGWPISRGNVRLAPPPPTTSWGVTSGLGRALCGGKRSLASEFLSVRPLRSLRIATNFCSLHHLWPASETAEEISE